jgi:endogenous inhibitor of DNA gyrase (YacG/DUF329 family)
MADQGTLALDPNSRIPTRGRPDSPSAQRDPQSARPAVGQVTCPTCRTKTTWQGNAQRPFCSLTCRLIDLGQWLDERYRIPPAAADDVS